MALDIPNVKQGYEEFGGGLSNGFDMGQSMMMSPAKKKLLEAQAEAERKKANLPFGGASVPGVAGHVMGLQMVKMMYGENSPQYKQALDAFNMQQKGIQSRVDYQNGLTGSIPMRFTTAQGRGLIEQSNVAQGASPTGTPAGAPPIPGALPYNSPLPPKEQAQQYALKNLKNNVSADVLKKNLYSTNIDKTLDNINVDDLTHYSGLKGTAALIKDSAQSTSGKSAPQYIKYQEAVTAAKTLAKQVRQFYGDSITPSVQEGLNDLANPTYWLRHSDVAKAKFNKFKSILQQEMQTYRDATKGTAVYGGGSESQAVAPPAPPAQSEQPVPAQNNPNLQAQAAEAKAALISNGFSQEEADQMIQERMAKLQAGG